MRVQNLLLGLSLVMYGPLLARSTHIIFIMVDDMGYGDIEYNNDMFTNISTPNLKALAEEGVILDNYYTHQVCSPSRAALMSGRYAFRVGMGGDSPISWSERHGLPLKINGSSGFTDIHTLPQELQEEGYGTYMVGKWHLGYCNSELLPTSRGFDRFFGLYLGSQNHCTHKSGGSPYRGDDLRNDTSTVVTSSAGYSTTLFTEKAKDFIVEFQSSGKSNMFMYIAFTAPHTPMQKPDCSDSDDRAGFEAMVEAIDDAVLDIKNKLSTEGMLSNTLLIFVSDNGGGSGNWASNLPLRGQKGTLFEGGTRVPAFVWADSTSNLLSNVPRKQTELFHVADWLPTLVEGVAGSTVNDMDIDGKNLWDMIKDNSGSTTRSEVVYDICSSCNSGGGMYAIRDSQYKYMYTDNSDGIDHQGANWELSTVGLTAEPCKSMHGPAWIKKDEKILKKDKITEMLFDLTNDPYECFNLANSANSTILAAKTTLKTELTNTWIPKEVTISGSSTTCDVEADPHLASHGGYFSTGWCTLDSNDQIDNCI